MTYPVKRRGGTDTKMNNHSNSINGNMYDMRVIKWLYSKASESEFDNTWQWKYGKSINYDKLSIMHLFGSENLGAK